MIVPQSAIDLLKLREGYEEKVYLDSLGLPTAGLGHLLTPSERGQYALGSEVPEEQLAVWTKTDSLSAYAAAVNQAHLLGVGDQHFIDVLCSVNFQLGWKWYNRFPKTWTHMMQHEWELAAQEVAESKWAKQTPVRVKDFQDALLALAKPVEA